jgi:hypothetical protein
VKTPMASHKQAFREYLQPECSWIATGTIREVHKQVAGLLDYPRTNGAGGDPRQMHAAGAVLDENGIYRRRKTQEYGRADGAGSRSTWLVTPPHGGTAAAPGGPCDQEETTRRHMVGEHHGSRPEEQPCRPEPWTGFVGTHSRRIASVCSILLRSFACSRVQVVVMAGGRRACGC